MVGGDAGRTWPVLDGLAGGLAVHRPPLIQKLAGRLGIEVGASGPDIEQGLDAYTDGGQLGVGWGEDQVAD